ncbi:MAG: hypothetical protein WHT65_08635 [Pseudothermotoga sp.]
MNINLLRRLGIYIFGAVVLALDSAYFDLFSLLTLYLAFEYLIFSGNLCTIRVMVFLIFHSALCFQSVRILHLIIFAVYIVFIVVRDYFLKPFFPFLLYVTAIAVLSIAEGSYWLTACVIALLSIFLWRFGFEKT